MDLAATAVISEEAEETLVEGATSVEEDSEVSKLNRSVAGMYDGQPGCRSRTPVFGMQYYLSVHEETVIFI
jgi:hypothetical protein